MVVREVPVRLSVLGPADLLVTSLVAGLAAHGVEAERIPMHEVLRDRTTFPRRGPGVLLVDVDEHNPAPMIPGACRGGFTVLAIGSEAHRERAAAAIAAGAVGWIRKTATLDVLVQSVGAAADGRLRMSAEMYESWLAEHRAANDTLRASLEVLDRLSGREREVLGLLAEGVRAAEIAETLFLSMPTVRTHIRKILMKLDVNSQQQAAEVYRDTSRRLARLLGKVPNR